MKTVTLHDSQIQLGRVDSLQFTARVDGVAAAVTSAAYSVYRGGTVEKSGACAITAGATGQFSIAFAGTEWTQPYIDMRVVLVVTLTSGGTVFESNHLFSVVNFKAVTTCNDDTLKAYSPGLVNHLWTGTTTYQAQISQALSEVLGVLKRRGYSGAEIVDVSQLDQAVTWKALEIIYGGFSKQPEDIWERRETKAAQKFEAAVNEITLDISANYSGETTEQTSFAVVRCQR